MEQSVAGLVTDYMRNPVRVALGSVLKPAESVQLNAYEVRPGEKRALSGFQEGRFQVLVATDIASRGLHVDDVAHVINYDVPKMAEDFIHRVGRTGRAGLQGRASTLAAGAEVLELRQIERTLKLKMERLQTDTETAASPRRMIQNTLASRTLTALPGEVFV